MDSALSSWLDLGWEGGDNVINCSREVIKAIGASVDGEVWEGEGLTLFSACFTPLTGRVTDGG